MQEKINIIETFYFRVKALILTFRDFAGFP